MIIKLPNAKVVTFKYEQTICLNCNWIKSYDIALFLFSFQGLWANNGDALSRQYAGTNALKGDFTRTGERNLSGLMKDGMNSASRYYLNQFRDAYRQATIDLMTGQIVR